MGVCVCVWGCVYECVSEPVCRVVCVRACLRVFACGYAFICVWNCVNACERAGQVCAAICACVWFVRICIDTGYYMMRRGVDISAWEDAASKLRISTHTHTHTHTRINVFAALSGLRRNRIKEVQCIVTLLLTQVRSRRAIRNKGENFRKAMRISNLTPPKSATAAVPLECPFTEGCLHAHIWTCMHTQTHAHTRTHTHIHTHTHVHAHTYMHTHTSGLRVHMLVAYVDDTFVASIKLPT